jgi:hypothetical protein
MDISAQMEAEERGIKLPEVLPYYMRCRCCGKSVFTFDGTPLHTACIPRHWGKHARGVNASRCKEFKNA